MEIKLIHMDAQDFERLSSCRMEFDQHDWYRQVKDGRFEDVNAICNGANMGWIYWYENYTEFILAKSYLKSLGCDFKYSYDNATDSMVILTDYTVDVEVDA